MGGAFPTMTQWAKAPAPRHQLVLVSQTADDLVGPDHPIRLLEAFLNDVDWRGWEIRYDGHRGQPPIHPRLLAGAILYGLMRRIRSSRDLEEATRSRLDFMWFLDGRTVDHTTFAIFRTAHDAELKDLNRQMARKIVTRWGGDLLELVLDGTRVRASSDRQGARTAERLEKLIAACAEQLNAKLAEQNREDAREEEVEALRGEVAALEAQCEKFRAALAVAQTRDEAKRRKDGAECKAVRVPVTDPDSVILPNKEGGFAPNYTPTAAVDAATGAILSAGVVAGGDECAAVAVAVAECSETLGRAPDSLLADGNFADGADLQKLETQGIAAYMPTGADLSERNPANRPDPTQPVAPELWNKLPRVGKQLAPSALLYNAENDCYHCPMGQTLRRITKNANHRGEVAYHVYACPGKAGCPLGAQCVQGKADHRQVTRDQYQDVRDRTARRMATKAGRAIYRKRAPAIESVFGIVKQTMSVRQFLLRGLGKVRTEWNWVCGAYNLRKALSLLAARPAGAGIPPAAGTGMPAGTGMLAAAGG
jgi:transposase